MKFLILILAILPVYVTSDGFGDLLGQEFQIITIDHIREKRQAQNNYQPFSDAPAYIKQLVQAQQVHPPPVPVKLSNIPKLNFPPPQKPQIVSPSQVSQYQPQVMVVGSQQSDYQPRLPVAQFKKPIFPQQPQYRPQPNYAQSSPQALPLPPELQQLRQFQHNIGNAIPTKA